jgi:hypothetical protein
MRKEIVGDKWLTNYCLEFVKRGIRDKVLCDEKHASNSYQKYGGRLKYFSPITKFYEISDERVIKLEMINIHGETYIYNNTFACYTWEDDLLVGFEITSKYIASTQRSIFDFLWSQTTKQDSIDNFLADQS